MAARTLRIGVIIDSNTIHLADTTGYNDNVYFAHSGIRDRIGKPVNTVFTYLYHTEYLRFCHDTMLDGAILNRTKSEQLPVFHSYFGRHFLVAAGISSPDPADAEPPARIRTTGRAPGMSRCNLLELGHRDIALVSAVTTLSNLQ